MARKTMTPEWIGADERPDLPRSKQPTHPDAAAHHRGVFACKDRIAGSMAIA